MLTTAQQSVKAICKSNFDAVYYLDMSSNEFLHVSNEFLKQNSKHAKTKRPVKKGGPYPRIDKDKRRDEIYRLHFEYSYSARKIADLMKVNRNTVNGDIDYWYSHIFKRVNILNPEFKIVTGLERMQIQLTRLREQLDKTKSISERISIERLMYDINSKILYTYQKLAISSIRTLDMATQWYNDKMKKKNLSERGISYYDTITVSDKAHERINRIVNEDRKRRN